MNAEKPQEEKDIVEKEYVRLVENETIYYDETSLWEILKKICIIGFVISIVLGVISGYSLPSDVRERPFNELFPDYYLQGILVVGSIIGFLASGFTYVLLLDKIDKIQKEIGLNKEEHLYLNTYETHKNIDAFLSESNLKRKSYFKKQALKSAQELTIIIGGWRYGNVRLVSKLVGDQIDLIKNNMKRLVLSNIAEGEETILKKISGILIELCKYIHSPSIKGLSELNAMIGELPYKEYKFLTRKEKIGEYFYGKPRMFRLLFAFVIAISIAVVLLCLNQNIGIVCAVAVASFWGAFAGFDKLFSLKKE